MEIDWITLTAQVVNFVVLVLLLRYFLFGRIQDAVERREAEIGARLEAARTKEEEAQAHEARAREAREEVESERDRLLREAREEARAQREERMEQVREEAEEARERWRAALERERDDLLEEVRERAGQGVVAATERVLADLADHDLQSRVVETFRRRLARAGEEGGVRESLAGADPLIVRSAFELDEGARDRLRQTFREALDAQGEVRFETDEALVLGLRLEAGDQEIRWSAVDHLHELEERIGSLLERGEQGEER